MKKKDTTENILGGPVKVDYKGIAEFVKQELTTLRIIPFYDPEQYNALDGITDYFEPRVLALVKEILNDHEEIINNIFDESGRVFNIYSNVINSEIMKEIKVELFYLVKMIKSNKIHKRIVGNLVNYVEGPGIVMNQENLKSYIRNRKLSLSLLMFILKSNNTDWLDAYTNLNKELYSFRNTDFKKYNKDNPEYYIAAALSFKSKMNKISKKPNFSSFSRDIEIPRSTLIDKLERMKINDKIKSILKNDGKSLNKN